jgi:hypothetical protein
VRRARSVSRVSAFFFSSFIGCLSVHLEVLATNTPR